MNKKHFRQSPKVKELYLTETEVLRTIKNPNVIAYVEEFESPINNYLVLEFCNGGDMEKYVEK